MLFLETVLHSSGLSNKNVCHTCQQPTLAEQSSNYLRRQTPSSSWNRLSLQAEKQTKQFSWRVLQFLRTRTWTNEWERITSLAAFVLRDASHMHMQFTRQPGFALAWSSRKTGADQHPPIPEELMSSHPWLLAIETHTSDETQANPTVRLLDTLWSAVRQVSMYIWKDEDQACPSSSVYQHKCWYKRRACMCMHVCACMHARISICRVALHDFRLYNILLPEKHSMYYRVARAIYSLRNTYHDRCITRRQRAAMWSNGKWEYKWRERSSILELQAWLQPLFC